MDSTTKPEPRSSHDGLTKTERATLRDPHTYAVAACNPCRYIASSKEAFADFTIIIGYGRWVRMTSNTGSKIEMTIGEPCPCESSKRSDGACKHAAALLAVLIHRAAQGEAA